MEKPLLLGDERSSASRTDVQQSFARFFQSQTWEKPLLLGNERSSVRHYYLQDALFNVTALTDSAGTVVERYSYTPYGEATVLNASFVPLSVNSSAFGNELLYTGRRIDPATGLQLNRYRFYHQQLGRWVNRDPIGYLAGDMNLYGYVGGMPTYYIDSLGLELVFEGNKKDRREMERQRDKLKDNDPKAKEIIEDLEGSENLHTVKKKYPRKYPYNPEEGNNAFPRSDKKSRDGTGTGSRARYNYKESTNGFSSESVLYHELVHCWQMDKGEFDDSVDPDTGNKRSEDEAVDLADGYRNNVGEPTRDDYKNRSPPNP